MFWMNSVKGLPGFTTPGQRITNGIYKGFLVDPAFVKPPVLTHVEALAFAEGEPINANH